MFLVYIFCLSNITRKLTNICKLINISLKLTNMTNKKKKKKRIILQKDEEKNDYLLNQKLKKGHLL